MRTDAMILVAIALAGDATIFASDTAVARGWAARARSLLGSTPPSEEHAWLELREATLDGADSAVYAGTRRLAHGLGAFDAEMTAAVLEGDARVAEGEIENGLACMDEALAAACGDELEHPVAITFACCQLFAACGRVRDYGCGLQVLRRDGETFVRDPSRPLPPFRTGDLFPEGQRFTATPIGRRVLLRRA